MVVWPQGGKILLWEREREEKKGGLEILLKIILFYFNKNIEKGESERKSEGGQRDNSDNIEYSRLLEIAFKSFDTNLIKLKYFFLYIGL